MNKKPVLISIDTEGPCGSRPVEKLIWGKTSNGINAGIEMLLDIFDSNDVKALFFVDIAEAWECGEESIKEVLQYINQRGHDIGVHIHPDRMSDKDRRYMWQYTEEEQKEMIEKCTLFYESCLGRKPLSFRAGRYGINDTTLRILKEYDYTYDMSVFYGNKYCRLEKPITCNKLVEVNGIKEIPVSSFKSFKSIMYERFDKVDVSMEFSEFKRIVDKMCVDNSVDIVSFFAHSFSLLKWRKTPESPVFMEKEARKMDKMIRYMKKNGYIFIDERSLSDLNYKKDFQVSVTDYSSGLVTWVYFVKRAMAVLKARSENNI